MSNWGGKRPGAGRPQEPVKVRTSHMWDPIQIEALIVYARENNLPDVGAAIRHIVNRRLLAEAVRHEHEHQIESLHRKTETR